MPSSASSVVHCGWKPGKRPLKWKPKSARWAHHVDFLQQGPAGRTITTTTLIEEGSNILSSTVGENGSRPLFLASLPCETHWSPPEPEMRDSQSLRYLALALPECLPPSFPDYVTTDLTDYKNLAPCEPWMCQWTLRTSTKKEYPLVTAVSACRESPPSVRRTVQKSYSPRKRRPRVQDEG